MLMHVLYQINGRYVGSNLEESSSRGLPEMYDNI